MLKKNSLEHLFGALLSGPSFSWIPALEHILPNMQLFVVGGSVRDMLLERTSNDIDFVGRHILPEELQNALRTLGVVNLVGKHFGVFKFVPTGFDVNPYDIALPRRDHAFGLGGYRDVDVQSDPELPLEEDLSRRDFTINAMAYDVKKKKLIDPFDGQKDLKEKIIRTVGAPSERFAEDYTRMLRALRFSCQLGFSIEKETMHTIKKMIGCINETDEHGVRKVPYESIAKELMKSLIADPVATMDVWDGAGAWEYVMPELLLLKGCPQPKEFHSEGDVWVHTRLALQKLYSEECRQCIDEVFPEYCKKLANPHAPDVVLAVLLHDIAKPETLQTPELHGVDRIRNHEHDSIGAKKARAMGERHALSSPDECGVNIDRVEYLIRYHLIAGHGAIAQMKPTTIEKYFFKDPQLGTDLLLTIFADGAATITASGKPALEVLYEMMGRINGLLLKFREKTLAMKLPQPLIDGNDIMQTFKLSPSKEIGRLLNIARELQLSGEVTAKEEALRRLKAHL